MNKIVIYLSIVVLVLLVSSCGGSSGDEAEDSFVCVDLDTNFGMISLALNETRAPITVENFMAYVDDGFYDDTIFHRVIEGFMNQGGGVSTDFQFKPTADPIQNEADNGLKNRRGTIAMARVDDPHSATAQFFINVADNEWLDHTAPTQQGWGYAVFGRVSAGMDVVVAINQVQTTGNPPVVGSVADLPLNPVVLNTAGRVACS